MIYFSSAARARLARANLIDLWKARGRFCQPAGAGEQTVGAALEGDADFTPQGAERARRDRREDRAVEGVVDGKTDARPLLAVGLESPQDVEPAQRPVERLDVD